MMTLEQTSHKSLEVFNEMQCYVEECAADAERLDIVERGVFEMLLKLGRELMELYFAIAGDGDAGETVQPDQEVLKRQEELAVRKYRSVFGVIQVYRRVYAVRERQKTFAPLDVRLGFPEGEHSYVLQDFLQRFCVQNSFDDSVASLKDLFGLHVSKLTAEKLNQDFGEYIAQAREESQSTDFQEEEASILVASVDGKGVPMRGTVEHKRGLPETPAQKHQRKKREQKAVGQSKRRLPPGNGKTHKQMAWISAVFTIDAVPRTAADVLDERHNRVSTKRPKPVNKQVHAQMTDYNEGERVNGQDRIFQDIAAEVQARDPDSLKTLICLMDGQASLWDRQAVHLPNAIAILDIFHVSGKLWEAAYCFHRQGSLEADAFVEHYFELILNGKVATVIRSLRSRAHGLDEGNRRKLQSVIGYYNNNQSLMKYDAYLKQGFPIASGAIEGACRHLVKDRMECTGMRWQVNGAQAMLNTRSAFINDQWDEMIEYRIQKQQTRLYSHAA
jgi:hypothetical protein